MAPTMHDVMTAAPVIAVLAIDDEADAVPLAEALVTGGLRVLEITLRTSAALPAIARVSAQVPDAIVGAGTVLTPEGLARAADAGARFAVSPGLTGALAQAARAAALPLLPGVATASEIMGALDAGYTHLKFFPAVPAGGAAALKAFAGPFPDVRFCPTGGIEAETAADFLRLPNVLCVGGSWVAPKDAVRAGDWTRVRALAEQAARLGGGR